MRAEVAGHGRVEKRHVSICQTLDDIRPWPGLVTLIHGKPIAFMPYKAIDGGIREFERIN